MNKQEKIIVGLLFALLLGWSFVNRQNLTGKVAKEGDSPAVTNQVPAVVTPPVTVSVDEPSKPATPIPALSVDVSEPKSTHTSAEKVEVISDDLLNIAVSSWGGGIVFAELKEYAATGDADSGPVVFDFTNAPALVLSGIPGLGVDSDFDVTFAESTGEIIVNRTTAEQLVFRRVIKLEGSYQLSIVDEFVNMSTEPMTLGTHDVEMGPMRKVKTKASTKRGMAYLDVNSLASDAGDRVVFWETEGKPQGSKENKLSKRFRKGIAGGGIPFFGPGLERQLPFQIDPVRIEQPTDWVSLKNKFFVQTLMPAQDASGMVMHAKRVVAAQEDPAIAKSWAKSASLGEVRAALTFEGRVLEAGETMTREMRYYVGPKKYDLLKQMGSYNERLMFRTWKGWGWFRYVCVGLLKVLTGIYSVIPNYGVAIILLTVFVKMLFWPIMQKSTNSMKKMQALKPELDILKAKHKSNPQKMQQEQMALYKKNGVNPMASCLPMVIQMPVFIAMFSVIRKAVELRSAGFLWVTDLSEPEMLFVDVLPMPLNILPLLMAGTMFLQQKMTPSTGDAQQKQMMMMMPVMMLFFLYNMASGLTLYWTVSQLLSILQLYLQNRKS